jgi:hypothetical protein
VKYEYLLVAKQIGTCDPDLLRSMVKMKAEVLVSLTLSPRVSVRFPASLHVKRR